MQVKKRVMVVKYGYAVVEAETDAEAVEKAENMSDSEFDWSDFDDAQVVDDDVDDLNQDKDRYMVLGTIRGTEEEAKERLKNILCSGSIR